VVQRREELKAGNHLEGGEKNNLCVGATTRVEAGCARKGTDRIGMPVLTFRHSKEAAYHRGEKKKVERIKNESALNLIR